MILVIPIFDDKKRNVFSLALQLVLWALSAFKSLSITRVSSLFNNIFFPGLSTVR
jgi:hypothetical protein